MASRIEIREEDCNDRMEAKPFVRMILCKGSVNGENSKKMKSLVAKRNVFPANMRWRGEAAPTRLE